MEPPSEPPFIHNFHYEYCDLPSMTIPQFGQQAYADERGILANPGMVNPHGSQSRGASTLVTPVGRPPSTREPTSGYSGATVAPESSFSSDALLPIHCSQASDEIFNLTTFDADSRNASLPIFPTSGFQYSGWDGERGGPKPNDHSRSFSSPANQSRNNDQPTVHRYTQCVPAMFATVPMQDIDENWMNTNTHTFSTTTAPPLVPKGQVSDVVPIAGHRESTQTKVTDPERSTRGNGAESGMPQTQDFQWYGPDSTTIYDSKATEEFSGTPDIACATPGPIISEPPTFLSLHRSEQTILDRPGKKPPVEYEADPMELKKRCERQGGKSSATAWVAKVFRNGVNVEALVRYLTQSEIEEFNSRGGFAPAQAYDYFLEKDGIRFACGLCHESKRMSWKNKKDAVRHLRKFHFGLADNCRECNKKLYSMGEMNTHQRSHPST